MAFHRAEDSAHRQSGESSAGPTLLFVTLFLMTLVLGACSEPTLSGIVRAPAPYVGDVSLPDSTDAEGDFLTIAEEGRLLVVYFGYTHCPDICPTTLSDLRSAIQDLGNDGDRVDVAFITIDPERDGSENISAYVRSFFADGHALRTDDMSRLETAVVSYGAAFSITKAADGAVDVGHTSLLYAVDSTGHILVQWPFGTLSEDMANDLKILLRKET